MDILPEFVTIKMINSVAVRTALVHSYILLRTPYSSVLLVPKDYVSYGTQEHINNSL